MLVRVLVLVDEGKCGVFLVRNLEKRSCQAGSTLANGDQHRGYSHARI